MSKEYRSGIGVMSGTSLDGIDLAWCTFERTGSHWTYRIDKACTMPYEAAMREKLAHATDLSALEYAQLDVELGALIARHINDWIGNSDKPDFIASHGHTVFHQPGKGLTTQIGSGAVIAAHTGVTTVCDFRTLDVAMGGQGAPLVPIGDELLFGQYDACLNLGGFANISFRRNGTRVAFDISPCNMALNHIANRIGLPYDKDGKLAASGSLISTLLEELDNLDFYHKNPPKSLGKEWFEAHFLPILEKYVADNTTEDLLQTLVQHIAGQIAASVPNDACILLATGGGALNKHLIRTLSTQWSGNLTVPDILTVNYKEALVFAFLGLLRLDGENNCLKSVTGAKCDNCGGAVYFV